MAATVVKLEPPEDINETPHLTVRTDLMPAQIKVKSEPVDEESGKSSSEDNSVLSKLTFQDELKDLPEVQKYIGQLQTSLIRQQLKIDKLSTKIKKLKKHYKKKSKATHITNASTQTYSHDVVQQPVAINSHSVPSQATETATPWGLREEDQANGATSLSIAEQVKQAAQTALQNTSFVYEPNSGMYYDYSTGYYYNAELGLYYDGNTGTYFTYDERSKSYIFHSQVSTFKSEPTPKVVEVVPKVEPVIPKKKQVRRVQQSKGSNATVINIKKAEKKARGSESPEEGEISDSTNSEPEPEQEVLESESEEDVNVPSPSATVWPPCMRIIVQETVVTGLKVGTLFVVTCTGGTMGREGDHCVLIRDTNISKHHAKFSFNEEEGKYYIVDLGSRNGSNLNGKRMSVALQESEPFEIVHGSVLTVGGTKLMCHIHAGSETCGHCEPGLVQQPIVEPKPHYQFTSGSMRKQHMKELKRIRKKFGVTPNKNEGVHLKPGYEDRAMKRRVKVGSSHHTEKTQAASVHEAITEDNKGFKMLAKMGWSKGDALGKDGGGLVEPVLVVQRRDKEGLGATADSAQSSASRSRTADSVIKLTQRRYERATLLDVAAPALDFAYEEAAAGDVEARKPTVTRKKEAHALSTDSVEGRKDSVWRRTQQRIKLKKKTTTTTTTIDDNDKKDTVIEKDD